MKLTKEQFQAITVIMQQACDEQLANEKEAAELRAAIAEHDPALACMMLDSAELTAQVGVYLSGRRETVH